MTVLATHNQTQTCSTCYWFARNKIAASGDCTKHRGQQVRSLQLERTRVAYPRTLSSEGCPEYKVRE